MMSSYVELQSGSVDLSNETGHRNVDNKKSERRILHFDEKGAYQSPESLNREPFIGNKIKTSKYSLLTFIPLNLFEQVIRPANFYFIIIATLQLIPAVSTTNGTPTMLLPLTFVFTVTAIKDALEDSKRHRDDKRENERLVDVKQSNDTFTPKRCEDLKVGEVVRIKDRERFPADLLLICPAKTHEAPYCYVETSNIDGETNLKLKQCAEGLNTLKSFEELKTRIYNCSIQAEAPNEHLDTWSGVIKDFKFYMTDEYNKEQKDDCDSRNVHLSFDNLLLRGSELRNSDWIYGLVIYAGFDCKIFMNNESRKTQRIKRSSVEKTVGKLIFCMATLQFFMCILCAVCSGVWTSKNDKLWYLEDKSSPALDAFYKFFSWFIIFSQFIPISLLVSMETVKFIQAKFMEWDIQMYTRLRGTTDKFCSVQNSNLNEELGQIDYVFSDKTGTLTDNSLDFRKCVIGNKDYGRGDTEIGRAAKRRQQALESQENQKKLSRAYSADQSVAAERNNNFPHVNFDQEIELREQLKLAYDKSSNDTHSEMVRRFLTVLAINNSCYPVLDSSTNALSIRAASPDDECLTCFAQFMGIQLTERNPPSIKLDIFPDGLSNGDTKFQENWEQLAELPFTSKRKRMSVIVRNLQTGNIHFTMKGADSEMIELIDWNGNVENSEYVSKYMEEYSEQGLRTLIIAEAILESDWWDNNWFKKYVNFQHDTLIMEATEKGHIKGSCCDACRKCKWYESIERAAKCELLGCTAIEDKLQESVPETISLMLDSGINVWVLTGDKQKTAENIGIACNLLEPAMEKCDMLFKLTDGQTFKLKDAMKEAIEKIEKNNNRQPAGLVINGKALKVIMDNNHGNNESINEELQGLFLQLGILCKSVIGVRLQPNQKAQIITFIGQQTGARTLAIGDGTNDEPMIRAANVGIGIAGLEGTAAVRASDYAIGKFKFIKRLLFVYGNLNYRRITTLVCYMFYKNGLLALSSFYFGFYNGFSGVKPYSQWPDQLYNIVFTCIPILLFAIIDRDKGFTDKYLIQKPKLYQFGQTNANLNLKVFFIWIFESWIASLLLTLIPLYSYGYNTSSDYTGTSSGFWTVGVVILTSIVITANIRLVCITNTWIALTHIFLWATIAAYFISMSIINSSVFFGDEMYWVFFRLMGTMKYWLIVFLVTVIALYPSFTYRVFEPFIKEKLRSNNQTGKGK